MTHLFLLTRQTLDYLKLKDFWDTVLSLVALLVSLYAIYHSSRENKKIHSSNMESDFYREIFFQFLSEKIPDNWYKIRYTDGKFSNLDYLILELNNLRKNILFFKFKDPSFYNTLFAKLQSTEDHLVEMGNPNASSQSYSNQEKLDNLLAEIYQFILNKYMGF